MLASIIAKKTFHLLTWPIRANLTTVMITALLGGLFLGLFFGEMIGWVSWIGDAAIRLMQMTILPYIVVSLIGGIGRLSVDHAKLLFTRAFVTLLLMWAASVAVILLVPLSFPSTNNSSFFSASFVQAQESVNFLDIYIPVNPFKSMAEGAIPAAVLFSISIGVALIKLKTKKSLLESLESLSQAMSRVTNAIVKILPIGVFAMTANAAGSLTLDEFSSLQVFLISYTVLCLLLAFWVLPYLIACFTPFSTQEVLRISRDILITAFATGNVLILLPVISERVKTLYRKHRMLEDSTKQLIDVIMPVGFSFPNAGKLTVLMFVLFAGWFEGKNIAFVDYPLFAISGVMSLFGSVFMAVPYMLENFKLSSDLFELFLISTVAVNRLNSLAAAMHLLALTLLAVSFIQNQTIWSLKRAVKFIVFGLFVSAAILFAFRFLNSLLISSENRIGQQLSNMRIPDKVPEHVYASIPNNYKNEDFTTTDVNIIKQRETLRIGYNPNNVPFSFFNKDGQLVGLDISMAHKLAKDLDVDIEFIPFSGNEVSEPLNKGYFDIAMSGIEINIADIQKIHFTKPLMQLNLGLLTLDHRMKEFSSMETIKMHQGFVLAALGNDSLVEQIRKSRDNIKVVKITNYDQFFADEMPYDALLISAEAGYAWSILYPSYGVVLPTGASRQFPTGYAVAKNNEELIDFVDDWLDIQKTNGYLDKQYAFWIEGKGAKEKEKRWSILKDVLGFVD